MPIEVRIDPEARLVRADVSGSFTTVEIFRTISQAVADPRFGAGFDILSDHRQVTEFLTGDQARLVAGHVEGLSRFFAGAKWAVVTTHPASFGMMRMLSVLLEPVPLELRVFQSTEDALVWLGR